MLRSAPAQQPAVALAAAVQAWAAAVAVEMQPIDHVIEDVLPIGSQAWAVSGFGIVPVTIEFRVANFCNFSQTLEIVYIYDLEPFRRTNTSYPPPGHRLFRAFVDAKAYVNQCHSANLDSIPPQQKSEVDTGYDCAILPLNTGEP